jgi:SAM-dependent methyltransferase
MLRAGQSRARLAWQRRPGPFYCPVCETRLSRFSPLPPFYREQWQRHGFNDLEHEAETLNVEQYICPRCGANDRDRLYALYLNECLVNASATFKLVDFAPSTPLRGWIQRTHRIQYRTADLFMENVDDRVDLTDMRIYPDGSVDAFICSHILEHIPDDRRALQELFRILKPGGWGILMVPICLSQKEVFEDPAKATTEADRWRYFGQGDHVRIYSKQGFIGRVVSVGFRVAELGREHFGDATFRRDGIASRSVLYVVEK